MDVKLRDVLAGRAGRSGKPQHQGVIDRLAAHVAEQRSRRHSRRRDFSCELPQRRASLGARHANDRDRVWRSAG